MTIIKLFLVLLFVTIAKSDMFEDMVQQQNLTCECHYVTTEDGYILRLHRILPKQNNSTATPKPMFFMHGLVASSPSYIIHPNKRSAGYFFSDLGYDVWIGNARGNLFSRNHTKLDPDKKSFWQFGFHEIGVYDLAAMIDFILLTTNQTKLIYTGHSQGVTSVFILLCERPEYNDKIEILHAMTPPVIMKYNRPNLQIVFDQRNDIESYVISNGNYELFPYESSHKLLKPMAELCVFPLIANVCKAVLTSFIGPASSMNWHITTPIKYAINIPSGSSYRQFVHFGQLGASGLFQKYDYGQKKNLKLYGTEYPPEYNLSNIKTKIHIIYGTNDYVVAEENIPLLLEKINKSVVAISKMDKFNHMDFAYGMDILSVQKAILKCTQQFT